MATLQVYLTLNTVSPEGNDLGALKVSVPIDAPFAPYGNLQREAGRMRDALKELWEKHYGADPAAAPTVAGWSLEIAASLGEFEYTDSKRETLPLDFTVRVFVLLHQMLIDATAGLAAK